MTQHDTADADLLAWYDATKLRSLTSAEPACTETLTRGFISWRAAALTSATLRGNVHCTFAP